MPVAIQVIHRTLPGARDRVKDVWLRHMPDAVCAHAGHLAYFYTFDDADPDVIRAFQVYRDDGSAKAFLDDEGYRNYVTEVEPLLSGPPEVLRSHVVWAKGQDDARR